jgi:hypothetical protein
VPVAPFHLGPAFLIGMLFLRRIKMAAILAASVTIDIEPVSVYCLTTASCMVFSTLMLVQRYFL